MSINGKLLNIITITLLFNSLLFRLLFVFYINIKEEELFLDEIIYSKLLLEYFS